uniref:UPF0488 protein C8orf33 homolog isoform X1 n=1 Tax=Centroberyx gerrardi TaxID=166262 RepID=UPI003AADD0F9
MAEQRLLVIDIEPKSNSSTPAGPGRAEKALWTRSDNSFKFNFFSGDSPAAQQEETPSSDRKPPSNKSAGLTAFTGQGSGFAFNFQIPPVPPEDMKMETLEAAASSPSSQNCVREENPSDSQQQVSSPPQPTKAKKKKKSGKKKAPESTEVQQKPSPTEGSGGGEDPVLGAEEQLNRELDWCIEQLELGMRTQKGTPKQKEEASRALKTLRSSKAPLAKKRQVMRAMTGDYRKKMEEEKDKQFRLIQGAIASAQVKAVSNSSKTSVFHRRAEIQTHTPATEEKSKRQTLQTESQAANTSAATQQEVSTFVFAPSKEEFRFNFLDS